MGLQYGLPIGALLANLGFQLYGAHKNANATNEYERNLNKQLQASGASPLDLKPRMLAFGNQASRITRDDQLYKNALEQYQNQQQLKDYNTQGAKFGLAPLGSVTSAKEITQPYSSQDAQFSTAGRYGQQALQGVSYLNNLTQGSQSQPNVSAPQPYTNGIPVGATPGGTPLMDDTPLISPGMSPQALQIGATQTILPDIPDGAYITPEMVNNWQQRSTTERGQDITAQTAANRLDFDKQKYDETEKPNALARLRKINQEIQAISTKNRYLGRLLEAEIGAKNRSNRSSGGSSRPTASQEFDQRLMDGVRTGLWTQDEANQAKRVHDLNLGSAGSDSITSNYDANGNLIGTTRTTRSRANGPSGTPAPRVSNPTTVQGSNGRGYTF